MFISQCQVYIIHLFYIFRSDNSLTSTYALLGTFILGLGLGFLLYFVCNIGINTYRVKHKKKPICICIVDAFSCKSQRKSNKEIDNHLKKMGNKTMSTLDSSSSDECESSQQKCHRSPPKIKRNIMQKDHYFEIEVYKLPSKKRRRKKRTSSC